MKRAHLRGLGPGALVPQCSSPLPQNHPRTYKVIHAKLPQNFTKKAMENSQSIQPDITALSVAKKLTLNRISEVFNPELAKQISRDINKYLPSRLWYQPQTATEEDNSSQLRSENASSQQACVLPREELAALEKRRETIQRQMNGHKPINREQHSFEEAMNFAHYDSRSRAPLSTHHHQSVSSASIAPPIKPPRTGIVQQISNMMPKIGSNKEDKVQKQEAMHRAMSRKQSLAQSSAEQKTKGLVIALRASTSNISKLRRLEELCKHLNEHPMTKNKAVKEKAIPCLLKLRDSRDVSIQEHAMEALALTGYVNPVRGRGIRILSLDGGGTRGLVAIEMLRKLEEGCGQEIHKLFDYVCGVSTGALIGIMSVVFRVPLAETEQLYKSFSAEMFSRNKLMGVGKLFMSHSYYDALLWEKILQ